MAGILLILLRVVLIVLLAVLVLALLLLTVRTGVEAVGVNGDITIDLRYGIVRIPLYPPPHRKKKEEKPPPPAAEKPPAPKKKGLNLREIELEQAIDLLFTLLGEASDSLRISKLRVRVLFGTDDAAKTGLYLGYFSTLCGMVTPFLENTFDMKDYHVSADADFDADHTEWAFTVFCSIRPLRLALILLRHGKKLYRMYKNLTKKEEAIENE